MGSALGGLAVTGAWRAAAAQSATRIEQFDPDLGHLLDKSQPVQELAAGLAGDKGPTEGPVWWKEGGYLLFEDISASKRMKYTPGQGVSVVKESVGHANGLTRDRQGRLVICDQDGRRVIREEPDGSITVLANNFQAHPLNRPNDVVVRSDGSIYFSDPKGFTLPDPWDLPFAGVYRVSADLGSVALLTDSFILPNGLAFSPDESVLYINDTRRGHIRAFDLDPRGLLRMETDRVFADLRGSEPGVPDGMKVDSAGNVYCGGSGGLWIFDSAGRKLGRIVHGHPSTTNIAFGGDDWKTLYFTTTRTLGAVNLKIPGIPVPSRR
jgi:gluconolactonase